MLEKQSLSNANIISNLKAHYGIEITALHFLPIGADTNASVYKAEAGDKGCYFVKLKRDYNDEISLTITKLLDEAGLLHVIVPIKTLQGQLFQRIGDFTLIVYPFIEGQDGFSRDLTNDQWFLLGKALRQIHELEVPSSIQSQIRRETYSNRWRIAVKSFLVHLETTPNGGETTLQFLRFVKDKQIVIDRLVNRAEQLAQKLKDQQAKFVLCHSDIHGGNVLIDKNNSIYIVDWDEPIMAPKERDLMFIGGGVANVWNKPHEEEYFYKGYGKTEVNREIVVYYRHERIVEDIAIYSQEMLSASVTRSDKHKISEWFIDMFKPHGVVDIAFKSDY